MWPVLSVFLIISASEAAPSLNIYNYIIKQGEPYHFTNDHSPQPTLSNDEIAEYNFKTLDDGTLKIVCDSIEMKQGSPTDECSNVYISTTENGVEKRVCDTKIDNFVHKTAGNSVTVKFVAGVLFDCTVLNMAAPKPEVIKLHPNGKAVMIGELSDPIPYYDHLWEFHSPPGTRMSFQCITGMNEVTPVCGKNVFTFDSGENITEFCGSDYMILFSKGNHAKLRLQLDEAGDGYFECLSQAVTGPNANEYENAVSAEVDSSEHGIRPGPKRTSCKCGWSNKNGARIVHGTEAGPNEFPWMVFLQISLNNGNSTMMSSCGASIITPRHVLTAAHCVVSDNAPVPPQDVKIFLGKHYRNVSEKYEIKMNAERIFVRDEFLHNGISYHDIAIILTKDRVEFSNHIGPVCIEPEELPVINRRITIMGWGLTEERKTSGVLRKSKARVMDPSVCGGNEWDVCTMTTPSATCSGDSGGPLVWLDPRTNRYTQISLVSRGNEDCSLTASISTLVAYFYEWIQEVIKKSDSSVTTCGMI